MAQKVLIVDDAPQIHALVRARLGGEPIEILSAATGEEGLRMAREMAPDLILLDVEMPFPDGFEVCRRLKADPLTACVPVVFLTGASTSKEKILGLELGAVDYVTKPFDPAELRARVRASLRTKFLMDLLAKKAQIDGLTGLWNRSFFEQRLSQEMSLAARNGAPLSCVFLDVDHFKQINDEHGHPFGDQVLRQLADALMGTCRREDVVCRFGGEEFVILVPNTALAGAVTLAERLRQAVPQQAAVHGGVRVPATCSFGVAQMAADGGPQFVEEADRALYRAKAAGRNRVEAAATNVPPASLAKAG